MRNSARFVVMMLLVCCSGYCLAQDTVTDLVKDGVALGAQKNYPAAIEKYKSALAQQPDNVQANYQMAFALFASGKNAEALPYVKKATELSTELKFKAAAYSLQGSIYGNLNRSFEAIQAYRNAIAADSTNQRIYYNLGIAQFKAKQYDDAEQTFASALKRDAKDAGSARMYALAAFHQNKRIEALLGFCYFLTLEPNSSRSGEAFNNLQSILSGGTLKAEAGYKPVLSPATRAGNLLLTKALMPFKTRRYASQADLLAAQLEAVITALGNAPRDKQYFWYSLADRFASLSAAGHMPAFARYISQSAWPESAKWVKANAEKVADLEPMLTKTP